MKTYKLFFLIVLVSFISGCGNTKKADKDNGNMLEENKGEDLTIYNSDFYADARDESWDLKISYNNGLSFNDVKNGISFVSGKIEKSVAQGSDVVHVFSKNKHYTVHITISVIDCKSGGKQTNISVKENESDKEYTYSDCGFYRGAPQLHDIWVLEELNGEKIAAEKFPKELPHFEFDLTKQTMSGFAGCNQVNGQIKFEYNKIIIEPLVSTRMYCEGVSDIENAILEILRNKPAYHFKNTFLYLETVGGSLILKKND